MTQTHLSTDNRFLNDVRAMRALAQQDLASGLAHANRNLDAEQAVTLLQTALAIEILCVWRYTMMSVSLAGLKTPRIGNEFQEQANDERRHMRMVAERIEQLGGTPDFCLETLSSRMVEYGSAADLAGMVAQNLVAEQGAIEHYRDLLRYFAGRDRITCEMLACILEDEENHATDMQDLLTLGDGQESEGAA
jgi:bacterioferritin